jgi:hypothetical protein
MTTEHDGAQAPVAGDATAGDTASETIATAAVADEAGQQPEAADETADKAAKTFTQDEVDALIAKRLSREQRKQAQLQRVAPPAVDAPAYAGTLKLEQFDSPEAYAEALADQKATERLQQRDAQRQQQEVHSAHLDREEAAREKYDDYEQVAYIPRLPITETMAETIRLSDIGPDLAYHLGQNPKEADRIAKLSPLSQAKELGKLEAKLADAPPVKRTTTAPAPISPVTPRSSSPAIDTTDPRSIKQMSTSEWIAAENARERRRLEAASR